MSINQLINELKENGQDFEFYPTTKEIIEQIYKYAPGRGEWLDIGAGTCNFKKYFDQIAQDQQKIYNAKEEEFRNSYKDNNGQFNYDLQPKECDKPKYISQYYVIEKSKILLEKMDKDVICLGTDFKATNLIDKPVDNIFCNPPYSEYEEWAEKIIFESNCKRIFLIIPERWEKSEKIQNAIKKSNSSYKILGSFDFLNAERQARAKINIVYISKNDDRYSDLKDYNEQAFNAWFDETFKMREKADISEWEIEREKKQKIKNQLVRNDISKAKILTDLYNDEMKTLYNHFKAISSLDVDILETIGISKSAVKEALKKHASGAKSRYWRLAFDELSEITDRLTSKTREKMLNKFTSLQSVDFTIENIYPLILWVLKNANEYYNEQLTNFFYKLSEPDNVKPYKSNQKVFERCEWRHNHFKNKDQVSHYTLDYRIIMSSPFRTNWNGTKLDDYQNGAKQTLQDIFTIANNLGFKIGLCDMPSGFGEKCTVLYEKSNKKFMEYRIYKNGNMHVKFDMEFMKAFNVEVSRLLGWIKTTEDIKKEFPEEMAKGAEKYFKINYACLNVSSLPLLTTKKEPKFDFLSNKDELVILINSPYTDCLETILNKINQISGIIKNKRDIIKKCFDILKEQKGFIYRNCLITKHDNNTKIEFREMTDFTTFEELIKEAAK